MIVQMRPKLIARREGEGYSMLFPPRVTGDDISKAVKLAGQKFPQRMLMVLHDGVAPAANVPAIDCRSFPIEQFQKLDLSNLAFVYACSNHFNGREFAKHLLAKRCPFIPVWTFGPAMYVDHNKVAHQVLENEWHSQNEEGYAKWDSGPGDFINLCQALEITRQREGVFLEIGCFRGSSGSVAMHYMNEAGIYRDAHFFDVFEGFEYDAARKSADAIWSGTHATDGIAAVERRLKRHEKAQAGLNVFVCRHNIVEEEIPAEIDKIAVANVDVDLYEAVLAGLIKVAPRMASGGIIVVEDPGHTPALVGARVALEEFLATKAAADFTPVHMESGQTFLIRREK